MSLESGRKLGLTASIFAITAPIILAITSVGLFIALLSSISSTIGRSTPSNTTLFPFTIFSVVIVAAAMIVSVIVFKLLLMAMKNLSKYYAEPAIYKNILNAFILYIISIVAIGVALAVIFATTATNNVVRTTSAPVVSAIWVISGLGLLLIGLLAIGIYSVVLTKRALDKLADKSGVNNFREAGLLLLIGAFVPFVPYVGWIFAAIGFNRLTPNKQGTRYPQYIAPAGSIKRCPHCGTENSPDAIYCRNCGRQL